MTAPLLACRKLTKQFGGLTALDGLDLSLGNGETLGLVGPNGSGKTTFFNIITGLYSATEGRIELDGVPVSSVSPQSFGNAGIARTFQRSRLMLEHSVFDNIATGALSRLDLSFFTAVLRRGLWKMQLKETVDRARTLLKRFNPYLAERMFEPAGVFTMIDRRRIEICRALFRSPRLLLLDEPSAGMTPDETRRLMDGLLSFRSELAHLSIILVEHEMDVIRRVSDRCVVLNFGRKIFEGDFKSLIGDPAVQTAYLGEGH